MSSPLEIYLGRLCPLILDFIESPKLISSFSASFEQSNVKEVIQQFETDSTCSSLFVEYIQDLTLEENPKAKESSSFTFNLEPVPAAGRRVVSLSLVKCDALPIHSNSCNDYLVLLGVKSSRSCCSGSFTHPSIGPNYLDHGHLRENLMSHVTFQLNN